MVGMMTVVVAVVVVVFWGRCTCGRGWDGRGAGRVRACVFVCLCAYTRMCVYVFAVVSE